jgi:uncharacterized protein (TIGR03663 family)
MQNNAATSGRLASDRRRSSLFHPHSSIIGRWTVFFVLALLAFALRLPKLGERPMHTDETVNAYLIGEILGGESYHYDPRDRHGPILYMLAEPLARVCGARNFSELTETELRMAPVIFGSATVLLFGAGVEMFGFTACLIAALLFTIAPLPVYYSRYFIHETLFVAFTLGLLVCGWRALKTNSVLATAATGLFAALLVGCKETFVIHFFALSLGAALVWFIPPRGKCPSLKIVVLTLGVFTVTAVILFTWFGQNWRGLADFFRAAPNMAARASGEGHQKSFGYYFGLVDGWFILFPLAIVGIYSAIRDAVVGSRKSGLLLAVYAVAVFLIYSTIPYKTPWLALNLWLPLTLLCGLGIASMLALLKNSINRCIVGIVIVCLLSLLGRKTVTLVFEKPADPKNPLAYAHTVEDVLRLPPRLEQLAKDQKLSAPLVAVVAVDAWPLPWYLRKFKRTGFWQPGQDPGRADFYITSLEAADQLGDKLKDWRPQFFGVRPEVLMILWVPDTPPHE